MLLYRSAQISTDVHDVHRDLRRERDLPFDAR